jgi:UDP:flavonoid glycosyltransferase YjiC (YdhE family)
MRFTLFAHGLRGDVWPAVALGWRLAQRDHDVTVAVPEEFRDFVERAGLHFQPLPFDMGEWLRTTEGQQLLRADGLELFRAAGREYSRHADALDDSFQAAAHGAEAPIGCLITVDRTLAMGDRLQVPVAMLSQYPVAPSRELPSVTMVRGRLPAALLNLICGKLAYAACGAAVKHRCGRFAPSSASEFVRGRPSTGSATTVPRSSTPSARLYVRARPTGRTASR